MKCPHCAVESPPGHIHTCSPQAPACEGCALAERGDPAMYVARCDSCRARMLADVSSDSRYREANGA